MSKTQTQNETNLKVPDEQIEEIVKTKTKRKRQDLTDYFTPHCEQGEISNMLQMSYDIAHWDPVDSNDAAQVSKRIDQYHLYCIQHDLKPDMSGLALAFGVSRKTLWAWETGHDSHKPQEVRNALKKGREINEHILVQMMNNGKINPIPALFLLKNNHEYVDQQNVVVTPQTPLDNLDSDEARKRLTESLPDDE